MTQVDNMDAKARIVDEDLRPEDNLHALIVELDIQGDTHQKKFNFEPRQVRRDTHEKAIKRWAEKVKENYREDQPQGLVGQEFDV